ncbi:MAG: helix-turn-helix transcriptional regulator [Chitinophagaceae bacterium]
MSNQVNIFLLLFGGLQGFLLSILLIKKRSHQAGYGFLVTYLLVMIAQVLLKVMSKVWLMENIMPYYLLSYKLPLLYGPLIYLFTKNILHQRRSQPTRDALHVIPFVFIAVFTFSAARYYLPGWIQFLFYGVSGAVIQIISLLTYHYFALSEWRQHCGRMKGYFSNTGQLRIQWLRKFIVGSFFVCTVISLLLYFMYRYYPHLQIVRWGFVSLSIFIYWISYEAINKPVLFSAVFTDDLQSRTVPVVPIPPKLIIHKRAEKYANTGLKEEEASRVLTALEQLMQEQKIFLDPEITIDKLAGLSNTNRHCLSQVLNERAGQSFYDYINQYRVNEAKRILLDPEYSNQKIASIAYDAGFNSLSAFNDVFKKVTGITPSQFKKDEQQVSRQQRG